MIHKISETGREMLCFQDEMAKKHKYKPIPIDLFLGNIRDKYEAVLPSWCKERTDQALYTTQGTKICNAFSRIVIGDYGAFVEITPEQICSGILMCKPGEEYRYREPRYSQNVKYLWLTAKDSSGCKIYFQKKPVDYADYVPGMYYISPYEVFPEQEKKGFMICHNILK